eukprot:3081585-Pleurochrysis_carterae.AAC.1
MSRPGCDGEYRSLVCDRRVELASAHIRARSARRCGSVPETARGIQGVFRESLQARPPAV